MNIRSISTERLDVEDESSVGHITPRSGNRTKATRSREDGRFFRPDGSSSSRSTMQHNTNGIENNSGNRRSASSYYQGEGGSNKIEKPRRKRLNKKNNKRETDSSSSSSNNNKNNKNSYGIGRSHRRSRSEGQFDAFQDDGWFGSSSRRQLQLQQQQQQQQQLANPGHNRTRSMPAMANNNSLYGQTIQIYHHHQQPNSSHGGVSVSGNPLMPKLHEPQPRSRNKNTNGTAAAAPVPASANAPAGRRIRSNSASKAYSRSGTNYGSFFDRPPPPQTSQISPLSQADPTDKFSPFSFAQWRTHQGAEISPSAAWGGGAAAVASTVSPSHSYKHDRPSPLAHLSPLHEGVAVATMPQPPLTLMSAPGNMEASFPPLHTPGNSNNNNSRDGISPHSAKLPETTPLISPLSSGGFGRRHSRRFSSSLRKMHMRHKSVELFMDNVRGVEQPTSCRNVFFALLFWAQILAIGVLAYIYGPNELLSAAGNGTQHLTVTYRNVIIVACISGGFAIILSAFILIFMMIIVRYLVQVALIFSIVLAIAWGIIGTIVSPHSFVPVMGIIALALTVGYTFVVWDRIPFAAANLRTALTGVEQNWSIVLVAFFFQIMALAWTILFTYTVIAVVDAFIVQNLIVSRNWRTWICILLGISFFWTFQVIMHIVQVLAAGVIGSWWFRQNDDGILCSSNFQKYLVRSTIFSFGSVCLGSLFVGIIQILRQTADNFRPTTTTTTNDESVLMWCCLHDCLHCIQECIVYMADSLASIFSPWAFTFIGLYGYGFLDAGGSARELFRKRGWKKSIVTDDLIPNILFMVCLVIGVVTGCFALFVEHMEKFHFTSLNNPTLTAFLIGTCVGFVLSNVLLGIISSSVNAVIVCFAGSPMDFQRNHEQLSNEMRNAWREVWPGCMDIVDIKIAISL